MILVTGGTGLVGSHLLLDLVKSGSKVRAIHRKNSNLQAVKNVFAYNLPKEEAAFLFDQIQWCEAALEDVPALIVAFKGITHVYHCAALVSFKAEDAAALRKINIEGTANVVNLCVAGCIEKLCYISSIATMAYTPEEPYVTENYNWNPEKDHSNYAISKHGAEIEVWRASQEGVPVLLLNPGIILGPGFWNKGTGLIFKKIANGLRFYFPKTTGFIGVNDVSMAALLAMNSVKINEQYLLISENISFKDVLFEVSKHFGKSAPNIALKPWMVKLGWLYQSIAHQLFGTEKLLSKRDATSLFEHSFYSNEKFKNDFKYQFTPVNKVIEETVKIYKKENEVY